MIEPIVIVVFAVGCFAAWAFIFLCSRILPVLRRRWLGFAGIRGSQSAPDFTVPRYADEEKQVLSVKGAAQAYVARALGRAAYGHFPPRLNPAVAALRHLLDRNDDIAKLAKGMLEQIPQTAPYDTDPTGRPTLRSVDAFLALLNKIIERPPTSDAAAMQAGLPAMPLNAALVWPSATTAGLEFFVHPKVNTALQAILNVWAGFLSSPYSAGTLNDEPGGWFAPDALSALTDVGNAGTPADQRRDFVDLYVCDPAAPNHGFPCWNDFFTREFRPGARPVASPKHPGLLTSPCEARVFRVATGVRLEDHFELKGQPYSLRDMLDGHDTEQFHGGTVYQAGLNPLAYHRWHAPCDGTVRHVRRVPGAYYAQSPTLALGGGAAGAPDPAAPWGSQGYASHVGARALVFLQADNPDIGLVCFVAIGMAEIGSVEVGVMPGAHVGKGDELGMFHFGGSSFALVFEPSTKVRFEKESGAVPVNGTLATVKS